MNQIESLCGDFNVGYLGSVELKELLLSLFSHSPWFPREANTHIEGRGMYPRKKLTGLDTGRHF